MTEDAPARHDGRRFRAWDGTLWNDRDTRDVHNHTHPTGGGHPFKALAWTDDDRWGSIKGYRRIRGTAVGLPPEKPATRTDPPA
jgi:hypothetical protein